MNDSVRWYESTSTLNRSPHNGRGGWFAQAVVVVSIVILAGCGGKPSPSASLPSIRMNPGPGDLRLATFDVTGLPAETLAKSDAAKALGRARFTVRADDGDDPLATSGDIPPMAGDWSVEENVLRFRPQFPLQFGQRYLAVFDPKGMLGLPDDAGLISAIFTLPKPKLLPLPHVLKVEPTSENVP